jgi:hypothetical protein
VEIDRITRSKGKDGLERVREPVLASKTARDFS